MTETYLYNRQLNKKTNFNVWLAFPECYSFSLSSLGYLWLYKELDEKKDILAERICTDTKTTTINPKQADAVGFSFSFDFDFLNIFKILDKYSIPFKSENRRQNGYPIIYAGGPVITTNPEPYKKIFDFMIIGDGEGVGVSAIEICKQYKSKDKQILLKKLAELDGIYVPEIHSFANPVKKSYIDLTEPVYTPILTSESFFPNTFIIETSRGCYNHCGFCTASYLNSPARFLDYNKIIEKIELGLQYTDKIALLGALVSAHPRFDDICSYISNKIKSGRNIEMSISSMRANTITPRVVKTLVEVGQKHITIAIEAASERLRKVINKNISKEDIYKAIRVSMENGLKGVKIYAMLGLPSETEEDIKEFITLAKELKQKFKGFSITFSFSTFVPKPNTPLQWSRRETTKSLESKINYLKKEFHKLGMGAKFSSPKWDYYQTLLSRGDETLTDYLIEVYKQGGKLGAFKNAAKQLKINTSKFTTDKIEIGHRFAPIDMTPNHTKLIKECKRLSSYM